MTAEICPYCRAALHAEDSAIACSGCGTKHHQDCYEENGGCTIFGCSCAPAEEPKLSISVPDLATVDATSSPVATTETAASAPPPPPPRPTVAATTEELRKIANAVVPSMFNSFTEYVNASTPEPQPPPPRSRTTFIVLGALLGAFGAHNFYAGYHKKGGFQAAITVLTLGFGSPMSWIWAIIDICTVSKDNWGVQFES